MLKREKLIFLFNNEEKKSTIPVMLTNLILILQENVICNERFCDELKLKSSQTRSPPEYAKNLFDRR